MLTLKYPNYLKKQRCEIIKCNNQPCGRFIREDLAIHLIMDTRTISSIDFKNKFDTRTINFDKN